MASASSVDWDLYLKAKEFLVDSFTRNPSYSFGDASIMIEHSLNAANIGMNLCTIYSYETTTVSIGCMFHDIGKAILMDGQPVDPKLLREKHEDFNLPMVKIFLGKTGIKGKMADNLSTLFSQKVSGGLKALIKDADIIELYMNVRLQTALKNWADANGFPNEMQRKASKFDAVLSFDKSKEMARPYWEAMKVRWKLN